MSWPSGVPQPPPYVSLPVPQPLALLDATLIFLGQVLIAQTPDLLGAEHEEDHFLPPPPLRAARTVIAAVREVHYALDAYRAALHDKPGFMANDNNDDFPF
jgi:hypothetical protein